MMSDECAGAAILPGRRAGNEVTPSETCATAAAHAGNHLQEK